MEHWIEWNGHNTWCQIEGDLDDTANPPLILLHGGPALPSDYLRPLSGLAADQRAVIRYDQLGCGNSASDDEDDSLWVMQTFVDELDAIIRNLGLREYHLFGHSWGGWLALEYSLQLRPPGLSSMVLASTCASLPSFAAVTRNLKATLPTEVQEVLDRHEAAGTTDSEEYFDAFMAYATRWLIRTEPPDYLMAAVSRQNEHINAVMQGPEWNVTGNLKDWDITDRLREIEVPVLVTSGRHDEMTPELVAPMVDRLPHAEWVVF